MCARRRSSTASPRSISSCRSSMRNARPPRPRRAARRRSSCRPRRRIRPTLAAGDVTPTRCCPGGDAPPAAGRGVRLAARRAGPPPSSASIPTRSRGTGARRAGHARRRARRRRRRPARGDEVVPFNNIRKRAAAGAARVEADVRAHAVRRRRRLLGDRSRAPRARRRGVRRRLLAHVPAVRRARRRRRVARVSRS